MLYAIVDYDCSYVKLVHFSEQGGNSEINGSICETKLLEARKDSG